MPSRQVGIGDLYAGRWIPTQELVTLPQRNKLAAVRTRDDPELKRRAWDVRLAVRRPQPEQATGAEAGAA
jgi:hypothetical protein